MQYLDRTRAQEILSRFDGKAVLVIGDVMLDEYVWGKVNRVSPEAPVMIVDADHHTFVPGGAANVVNNLCALGARSSVLGLLGDDGAARTLSEKLTQVGALTDCLITTPNRPTTLKTRVIAHTQQGSQQVVRVDHECRDPLDPSLQAKALESIRRKAPFCDAVLMSDYQKGLLNKDVIASAVTEARGAGKIVTGNIKPRGIGSHCRMTMLTMNVYEASESSGFFLGDDGGNSGSLNEAGRVILRKSGADNVLITRGAHGLSLFHADGEMFDLPAHPVEVFDGTGAGDTVISTLTLALCAGATPAEAVSLANYAGAVVVRKVGVATATTAEILAEIHDITG